MKILNFTVIMTPDETGGYVVTCPALPGLVTEGDTLEEARAMAADAIRGYIESLQKDGEPILTGYFNFDLRLNTFQIVPND